MAEYIDKNELYQVESLLKTSIVETDEVASFILEQVLHDIENFPAADVAPVVRGKWIDYSEPNEGGNCQCYCSNCYAGDVQRVGEKVPYCWKCGAQMGGE